MVLEFWGAAVHIPELADVNARSAAGWREQVTLWFEQESAAGRWIAPIEPQDAAQALIAFLVGTQVTATIGEPDVGVATELRRQRDTLLDSWMR